jgi:hypothetical protein
MAGGSAGDGGGGGGSGYAGAIAGGLQAFQRTNYQQQESKYAQRVARYNAQIARNQATEQMYAEQYQEKMRRRDAQFATINAKLSLDQALVREEETRRQGRRQIASQRAGSGASGVAVDSGSSLFAQVESARFAEFDAQLAGFGLRMDAFESTEDAKLLIVEAENHAARAQWLKDHGIEAAGYLYDVQASYYKKWAQFSEDTKWGNMIVGAIGGAFGARKSVLGPGAQDSPSQGPDPIGGDYDYDRASKLSGDAVDRSTSDWLRSRSDSIHSGGEKGASSADSFQINSQGGSYDAGGASGAM